MPLPASAPREHLHTRTVTCQGFLRQDGLWDIEGRIVDVKTYAFDNEWRGRVEPGVPVHEMWIRLTIDDRMEIKEVAAATDHSPFQICPDILPNFQRLVGVRIAHGFTREVRARLGGRRGCTHIVEMLQQVATVAFQTTVSERARALRQQQKTEAAKAAPAEATADPGLAAKPADRPKRPPIVVDTCHAWASDGPLVQRYMPDHFTGGAAAKAGAE
ncbi:MAG: DUF2889 domain-containing protein [Alphaproteobacteria bacterium]